MRIDPRLYFPLGIFSCLSWMGGIIIGSIWGVVGIWCIFLFCLILLVWRFPRWWFSLVCLACLLFGWGWSTRTLGDLEDTTHTLGEMVGWDGFTHTVGGKAGGLLSISEYSRRYHVSLNTIDGKAVQYDIALILPTNLTLIEGDTFTSVGKFSFPEDTPDYAGEKNLWYRGMAAEFQSFQNTKQSPKKYSILVQIQQWFDGKLQEIFPREGYQILSGMLLGQRSAMTEVLKTQLKASGLMHLMVVSGGNIMMLIIFLSLFIRSMPVWIRIGIIAGTVFAFALLVGGDMPVWRAALMGTIGYSAGLWGYRFRALILPLVVASVIAIWNPLSLVYDIGLQLSFLSVICIIVWGKQFAHTLRFLGSFFAEATALTLAATIGTLPITIFYFGTFSLIGPLANMIAAPAVPIVMYGGIMTLFASLFSETLAVGIGYIPWIATSYIGYIISLFGSQKWSLLTVNIDAYKSYFIVLSLGVLFLAIVKSQMHDPKIKKMTRTK